jgi:DNA-binding NarL/FixJ family response regulator
MDARLHAEDTMDEHLSTQPTGRGNQPIRVALVDDHPVIHEAVASVLRRHGDMLLCGTATSIESAFALVESSMPDVLVLDLILGEEDGIELIEGLRERYPYLKLVAYSTYDGIMYHARSIQAGAAAYVCKDESVSMLCGTTNWR